jgi:hypothetical protein
MKSTTDGALGSSWWTECSNLSFEELVIESKVPAKWARFDIISKQVLDDILIPVNGYVLNLYPKPDIVSINGNLVQLRQKTHAEIWVKPEDDNLLYALDKCHQRQFYPSNAKMKDQNCFSPTYKFYMPWVFSEDAELFISAVAGDESPFKIQERQLKNNKVDRKSRYINTDFINFKIKKNNKYMLSEKYGIIDIGAPMYDIFVKLKKEEISRLIKQYE